MTTKDRIDAICHRLRRLCDRCVMAPDNRNAARLLPYCDTCKLKNEAADELHRLTRERQALADTLSVEHDRCLLAENLTRQPDCCKSFAAAGWRFSYDEATRFVGASHPLGGEQSVAEVVKVWRNGFDADEIGRAVVRLLNGACNKTTNTNED